MKLKHFGVGCFPMCARCLFTDGVLQGSDSVGFFPAIKLSAGKKQRTEFRAYLYGAEAEAERLELSFFAKKCPQKVI